jgi:hypothetical protein
MPALPVFSFGQMMPREQGRMYHNVIAISEVTRQSSGPSKEGLDCFASLAMTELPPLRVQRQPLNARQASNSPAPSGQPG